MAHIEQYKFYPRAARRRGMQGVVEVSFRLRADGLAEQIQVSGSHPLLRRAAEAAVEKALPLPLPPEEIDLPMPLRFGMEFSLR